MRVDRRYPPRSFRSSILVCLTALFVGQRHLDAARWCRQGWRANNYRRPSSTPGSRGRLISAFALAAAPPSSLSLRATKLAKISPLGTTRLSEKMGMDRGWWKMIPRGGGAIAAVFPKAATAALALGEAGRHVFDSTPLLRAQLVLLGVNAVGYILTVTTKSHYHVDLLGTSAFALAAWPSLSSSNQRVLWSARIVAVWSVKLAGYLFYRVLQAGRDARLDEVLDSPYYAAGFWAFSWGWGAIASLPLTVGSTSSLVGNPLLTLVGASVATLGVLIETLADCQKWMFKKKQPRGSFCNAGLWSVSQHPNWFGNMLLWIGVFVMNASALIEPAVAPTTASDNPLRAAWSWLWRSRRAGLAFLSPCFMWYLLSGEATGRILPDAVEAYRKRYGYGTNAEFTKYVDTTPLIIPNPLQMLLGSKTKSE